MNVSVTETAAQAAIVVARKALADSPEMESLIFSALPEIGGHLAAQGVPPVGAPFRRTTAMVDDMLEFEVGFPVSSPVPVSGDMLQIELPAGQAATITHEGSYDNLQDSYITLVTWVSENNKQMTSGPWEVFLINPMETPDPKDWRTQIFIPVA